MKLQEGEKILFEGKPEKKIFLMWIFTKVIPACFIAGFLVLWATLFFGGIFFSLIAHRKEPTFYWLPSFFIIFIPIVFVFALFYYRKLIDTYHYYITNQRCIFNGGIIVKRQRSVPYHKITDVEINQNIFEQFLSIYSLKIFTPGTGSVGIPGFEKAEIIFYGLKDSETPANIIQNIIKGYKATGE